MVLTTLKPIDFIILIIIALLFVLAIFYLIRNKRKGITSGCSGCPLEEKCHSKKDCLKK